MPMWTGGGSQILLKLVDVITNGPIRYDTIRYDSVYLACSKKLTCSQLSPPHGTIKKLKCETKNKTMSMIVLSIRLEHSS